jgi:pimeloyl-ACP methyl ester carboxylesterase
LPLAEAGHLGGVLLQLSPCFKYDNPSLNVLTGLLDAVSTDKCDYAVEFRHRSWLDESKKERDPEVLRSCGQRKSPTSLSMVLALAATIAGPDGERVLRNFLAGMFTAEFPKANVARITEDSLKMPRSAAAELLLSVMQSDFRDLLPLIQWPTLCIGGKQSHLGPEVMPWIASRIPGARVVMFDTPHFVHLERPAEFNAKVCAFLEEIETASHFGI